MVDLYEQTASHYAEITGEDSRLGPARAFLTELRRRHPFGSVLDVACGTGLHAVMLAEMGAVVTAADISPAMLARARSRAASASPSPSFYLAPGDSPGAPFDDTPGAPRGSLRFIEAPMQELADRVPGPFDVILCLGNSLPHVLDPAELRAALAGFAGLLAARGVLVLHLLNYARILARGERIVGVTRSGQHEFVRFYDFLDGLVRFNVLTLRWHDGQCDSELASAPLRPYTRADLEPPLRAAGLTRIDLHAGLAFAPFDESESDTLTILAGRGE